MISDATCFARRRVEIEPQDVPLWFNSSKTIVQLCQHTLMDAQLVQKLMTKLQILPLTRQLTNISGNCWARTMKGNRAERTDYLLLHEFHRLKYICPDKQVYESKSGGPRREKAKYLGGLVLEPKKGLYDTFILLLDFNSLYPSIIQEYNLCHTTMDWAGHHAKMMAIKAAAGTRGGGGGGEDDDDDEVEEASQGDSEEVGNELPPLPDEGIETGVLPRVIRTIIQRRGIVKKMLKAKDLTGEKKKELDIRQKALKLTANSMYGCLGFSFSRFYAQPIAALITQMGRETLQRTVDIAQESVGLEVIYGDTDSIMINTNISDVEKVREREELNNLFYEAASYGERSDESTITVLRCSMSNSSSVAVRRCLPARREGEEGGEQALQDPGVRDRRSIQVDAVAEEEEVRRRDHGQGRRQADRGQGAQGS